MNRMTTKALAAELSKMRDNDVAAFIDGSPVPVVGTRYDSLIDTHIIELDPEAVEDAVLAHPTVEALDGALHTVWLHGNWFWLTRSMTTEEREAAAAAVRRHECLLHESGENPVDDRYLRWWAPEHRYNAHGVDLARITDGAVVEVERPGLGRVTGTVERRFAWSVRINRGQVAAPFDDVTRVISTPVDEALRRLDAPTPNPQKEA